MRIITPSEVAGQTQTKNLAALAAAKSARFVNDFHGDGSADWVGWGSEAAPPRLRRARARRPQVPPGPAAAPAGNLMPPAGRHVVLGVSGGIACYKSCTLARRLTESGATVDVVLTAAAAEFVRPLTF